MAFAAGLNSRNADSTGYAFVMPFSSIRNVKYDEKSRRIEFWQMEQAAIIQM